MHCVLKTAVESMWSWWFPINLYILLKIAATFPVTLCECERSVSRMRRLNNYMSCTMDERRLFSLAIMHIKTVWTERSRGTGGLKLLLQDTLQHTSSFVKRFVYALSRYVSLCMNVPSQTEILLLWLKIPVILDLIEFEIFTWRLLKIAFPVF